MGAFEIQQRTRWHDTRRINHLMTVIIVALYMVHIDRFRHAWPLIDFAQIIRQVGIVLNSLEITFEMAVIDRIKAHQCGKETDICFCQPFASQVALLA